MRHWPKGATPGSIELLGELDSGAQVRLVWHYLPFAPEYSETVQVLSARRRMRLELPAPSHGDSRSTLSLREKKSGVVQETATRAPKGAAELMWEAFHAFVEKGVAPVAGAAEAQRQVTLLREVLATIVEADGRSLEKEPEQESAETGVEPEAETAEQADGEQADGEPGAAEPGAAEPDTAEPGAADAPASSATGEGEPAPETLEQPAAPSAEEVVDVWSAEPVPEAEPDPTAEQGSAPAESAPAAGQDPAGGPEAEDSAR